MADVFLSYKREDRERCVAVHDALAALRLAVWFDARLELGVRFDKEIEREVRSASAILVLWSAASVDSDWVREEALVGRDRGCLVSARIERCELPMGFRAVQTADIHGGPLDAANAGWLQVLERIGAIVGRPGLADFVRCRDRADVAGWQAWLLARRDDPLMPDAVALLADSANPDLRRRLAEEHARRLVLEGEIEEYRASHTGQRHLLRESGAELARLKREQAKLAEESAALQARLGTLATDSQPELKAAVARELDSQAQAQAEEMVAAREAVGEPQARPQPASDTRRRPRWLWPAAAAGAGAAALAALLLVASPRSREEGEPSRPVADSAADFADLAERLKGRSSDADEAGGEAAPESVDASARNAADAAATDMAQREVERQGPPCSPGSFSVYFYPNDPAVPPDAAEILNNAVTAFSQSNCRTIDLSGFASGDEARGTARRRTGAVRTYLASRGIPSAAMRQRSRTLNSSRTEDMRAMQRRVEINFR